MSPHTSTFVARSDGEALHDPPDLPAAFEGAEPQVRHDDADERAVDLQTPRARAPFRRGERT